MTHTHAIKTLVKQEKLLWKLVETVNKKVTNLINTINIF